MPERALLVNELHTLEIRVSAPLNTDAPLLVGLLGRWLGDHGYTAIVEHRGRTELFSLVTQDDEAATKA